MIALAGGPRQLERLRELGARAGGVIAAMIDRLAHFGKRVRQDAAALAHDQRHQRRHAHFHEVGGAVERGGALPGRHFVPARRRGGGRRQRLLGGAVVGLDHASHDARAVGGVACLARCALALDPGDDRRRAPRLRRCGERIGEPRQRAGIGEVDAARIAPLGAVEIPRQRDARMRLGAQGGEALERIGDDLLDRRRVVDQPVDERGVGAVLQEAPHQIGQQILVPADRRIDAARQVGRDDLVVERLAHAVEALELERAIAPGERAHRGDAVRVVGRELREERFGLGEQPLDAGEIGGVGRELAGDRPDSRRARAPGCASPRCPNRRP